MFVHIGLGEPNIACVSVDRRIQMGAKTLSFRGGVVLVVLVLQLG